MANSMASSASHSALSARRSACVGLVGGVPLAGVLAQRVEVTGDLRPQLLPAGGHVVGVGLALGL
ncbi:hypothetical protein, partial [Mycolicibacterium insubricum]|uniref:hypothetical protein n=1 Tax=Mycolicibacterium insubricum TaxID=444597 RepID=UPI0021F28D93